MMLDLPDWLTHTAVGISMLVVGSAGGWVIRQYFIIQQRNSQIEHESKSANQELRHKEDNHEVELFQRIAPMLDKRIKSLEKNIAESQDNYLKVLMREQEALEREKQCQRIQVEQAKKIAEQSERIRQLEARVGKMENDQ